MRAYPIHIKKESLERDPLRRSGKRWRIGAHICVKAIFYHKTRVQESASCQMHVVPCDLDWWWSRSGQCLARPSGGAWECREAPRQNAICNKTKSSAAKIYKYYWTRIGLEKVHIRVLFPWSVPCRDAETGRKNGGGDTSKRWQSRAGRSCHVPFQAEGVPSRSSRLPFGKSHVRAPANRIAPGAMRPHPLRTYIFSFAYLRRTTYR
jgi:hypothetical protein